MMFFRLEDDEALRQRLLYVTATINQRGDRRVETATGVVLDELAEQYGLRRRAVDA